MASNFNPLNFLILALIWLIKTASIQADINAWLSYLAVILISSLNLCLLSPRIKWRKIILFSLVITPALLASCTAALIFTPEGPTSYKAAVNLSLRLYTLALISFMFTSNMPQETIIINLMQRKYLPVTIGFGLCAAINAFKQLAAEFKRIQIAYQMRYHRKLYSIKIILPLLVAATRYAQCSSISMFNRGLNSQRSYVTKLHPFHLTDYCLIATNLCAAVMLNMLN